MNDFVVYNQKLIKYSFNKIEHTVTVFKNENMDVWDTYCCTFYNP